MARKLNKKECKEIRPNKNKVDHCKKFINIKEEKYYNSGWEWRSIQKNMTTNCTKRQKTEPTRKIN